jgi:hypothetical protein
VDIFLRIIEVIAIMAAGHFFFGVLEDFLKKKKLFGYKQR